MSRALQQVEDFLAAGNYECTSEFYQCVYVGNMQNCIFPHLSKLLWGEAFGSLQGELGTFQIGWREHC